MELFGRLHPLVLHLPIGLLAGLAVMEIAAALRRKPVPREVTRTLVLLTAASAVLAAGTGYVLGREDGGTGVVLMRHQQLGIVLATACVLTAIVQMSSEGSRAYRVMLAICMVLLVPVGHLGGSMTHGDAFLTAPVARVLRTTALALDPVGETPAERAYAQAPAPQPGVECSTPTAEPDQPAAVAVDPSVPTAVAAVAEPPSAPQEPAPIAVAAAQADPPDLFATRVQPILTSHCTGCHGGERQKGGIALHTLDAIVAGGDSGPAFVAGRPADSEIIRRISSPESQRGHMPPKGKPQLTQEHIRAIEAWIETQKPLSSASGAIAVPAASAAKVEPPAQVSAPAALAAVAPAAAAVAEPRAIEKRPTPVVPPAPAALNALKEHLVHFEGTARDSNLLSINFAAATDKTDDALARTLLEPILANLDTLALSQCKVGDETAALLAGAAHLKRLDLRGTRVSEAGLAAIKDLSELEELVLARTKLTDAAVEPLAAMPALQRVFVWNAGLTAKAVDELKARRPGLYVNVGDFQESVASEVEPEIKLTSDLPPPGQAPPSQPQLAAQAIKPADLKPINNVCPVSGSPIDPRYAVVYKHRVIGFCCPKCPAQFWADPAQFESKLPPPAPVAAAGD